MAIFLTNSMATGSAFPNDQYLTCKGVPPGVTPYFVDGERNCWTAPNAGAFVWPAMNEEIFIGSANSCAMDCESWVMRALAACPASTVAGV